MIDGIGQGAQILLNLSGNTITGSVGGVDYFTISINAATGEVTFTQLHNIWHPNTSSFDETATLNTALASNIQVQQTVTDADGDHASATLNIGQGVFAIQDDGPSASLNGQATLDKITLDESAVGTDTSGGTPPLGVASGHANFADNFAAVTNYGTDGPGSTSSALLLSGVGIGSGQ